MKNIEELLRNIGVEIPSDKRDDFMKSFNDNYKTIKEVDGLRTKIEGCVQLFRFAEEENGEDDAIDRFQVVAEVDREG